MKISQEDTLGRENFNKFLEARPFIIQWILPNVRKIAKKRQSRPKNRPESYSEAPRTPTFGGGKITPDSRRRGFAFTKLRKDSFIIILDIFITLNLFTHDGSRKKI